MDVKIGGQAVMEGVMMKNQNKYAVSVRKVDGTIETKVEQCSSISDRFPVLKLPLLRGVINFVESMVVGMKTLSYSAEFFEEDEGEEPSKLDLWFEKTFSEKGQNILMGFVVILSFAIAIGLFMIFPYFVSSIFERFISSHGVILFIEGILRVAMFLGYLILVSRLEDIRRVFMYHGAEHKTINCIEAGDELTTENVMKHSRLHKRCGTSFLFLVMLISIVVYFFIQVDTMWLKVVSRLLLIPLIAGISYEFIRLAGNSNHPLVSLLSKPGLCLQHLTTREPDESMIEVAIASVEAVFDWREFLQKQKEETQ